MWNKVVQIIVSSVNGCFSWFDRLMNAIPGAWGSVFTIIVILILARFLLGPILGVTFSGSSDKAKISAMKKQNRLRNKANEE